MVDYIGAFEPLSSASVVSFRLNRSGGGIIITPDGISQAGSAEDDRRIDKIIDFLFPEAYSQRLDLLENGVVRHV